MVAINMRPAEAKYGSDGFAANIKPPAAGPNTEPICQAIELKAIARGKDAGGTMLGAIADIDGPTNTRATPCNAANRKRMGRVSPSMKVNQPKASATIMSMLLASRATVRRSQRSAAHPATGVSSASGTNCTSPKRPSCNDASRMDMP